MKRALGAVIALGSALLCGEARAFELGTPEGEHPHRTAQNAAVEFRFGPYEPNGHAFERSFGDHPRVYTGLELDWQIYRIPGIGTIGPAFQVGRASMSRKSRAVAGTYSLTIYPLCLDAVLRVDQFWRRYGVPFMPYAKAGFGVGFWDASAAFRTVLADNVRSSGRSFGQTVAVGAAVPLDFLDGGPSRSMDNAMGVNTSSVYLEYSALELNGFGAAHTLRVGDRSWVAGVMFEL